MLWNNDKELFKVMKEKMYTAVVGDIMDKMGILNQYLPAKVKPLHKDMVIVGRAMTVLEADMQAEKVGKNNPILGQTFGLMLDALDDLKEDEIYICAGSCTDYALVGELMVTRAKYLKAAGFVALGYIRDTKGIEDLGIPVFSYGSYSKDQAPRGKVIDYRVPIIAAGVEINPGDLIFGDYDGVVVVPQEKEEEIIKLAYEKTVGERLVGKAIASGLSSKDAFAKYGIM